MSIFTKKKICVTHNGAFHTDDLFATATLSILNNGNIKIIRTRDQRIMKTGDYVYDVGGEYDPKSNLFDHHQKGGAGNRENGIPYSSFGLIWKEYGEKICGSLDVAFEIDKKIVQPIDAIDNGIDVTTTIYKDVESYTINNITKAFYPTWDEEVKDVDKIFKQEVQKIIPLLEREIKVAQSNIKGEKIIMDDYNNAVDIANSCGTPVYAAADGIALSVAATNSRSVYANGGYGNNIRLQHVGGVITLYAHLKEVLINEGQEIKQGQLIGLMGGQPGMIGAGRSTGCHLHFEVRGATNPLIRY